MLGALQRQSCIKDLCHLSEAEPHQPGVQRISCALLPPTCTLGRGSNVALPTWAVADPPASLLLLQVSTTPAQNVCSWPPSRLLWLPGFASGIACGAGMGTQAPSLALLPMMILSCLTEYSLRCGTELP